MLWISAADTLHSRIFASQKWMELVAERKSEFDF
jgi:hypothetical protein